MDFRTATTLAEEKLLSEGWTKNDVHQMISPDGSVHALAGLNEGGGSGDEITVVRVHPVPIGRTSPDDWPIVIAF